MKQKEINGYTVLEADEGMVLLKGGEFICGKTAWLAMGDTTDAYKEVTVEEANALEKTQQETKGEKPDEEPPVETPTDIDIAKAAKIAEIEAYSDSDAVNSLSFHGMKTWLTRTVRDGYDTSITAAKNLGETNVTFMVGDNEMQLPVEQARRVLDLVQRYADACFIVTERHKIAVKALRTVEEVKAYDYTTGYPEKLAL